MRSIRAYVRSTIPLVLFLAGPLAATEPGNEPTRVHPRIWRGPEAQLNQSGYILTSDEGHVVINTGTARAAPELKRALTAVAPGAVKYIILVEGHGEIRGGVELWKRDHEPVVIAHETFAMLRQMMGRLNAFRKNRMKRQFGLWAGAEERAADAVEDREYAKRVGNFGEPLEADRLVKDGEVIEHGDLTLEFIHAPGETPDQLIVWIPELRVAFTGHNVANRFKLSVPRGGHHPRSALEWASSLDQILALDPELLLSPGLVLSGEAEIREHVEKLRDALLYVHDETVEGMNAGKDVYTLMQEIELPDALRLPESYGTVRWAVRGIYETYAGWYDDRLAELYAEHPAVANSELVTLAGGEESIIERAAELIRLGRPVTALRLLEVVESSGEVSERFLETRLHAIHSLLEREENFATRGFLRYEEWTIEEILDRFH